MHYLCLNMIVKDESHIIKETLESVVKYIDYYVISDTGSTDDTISIIKNFFDEKGILGEIYNDKWVDFGHNRSLALEHAHGKSEYIWVIDADDIIVGNMDVSNLTLDYYYIKFGNDFSYNRPNIFKNFKDYKWKYIGKLHEYASCDKPNMISGKINGDYYLKSRRLGNRNKDPNKYLNDALILEEELIKNPNNPRNTFYCARSYFDHGDYEKAIYFFTKRLSLGGYEDEIFYSLYQIALSQHNLKYDWKIVESSYMMAYNHSKHRLEPIYEIARHYRLNNDYNNAHKYTSIGIKIPYPPDKSLFVSSSLYKWKIVEEYALSSYYTNRFNESLKAYSFLINIKNLDDIALKRIQNGYNFAMKKVIENKKLCLIDFGNTVVEKNSSIWNFVADISKYYIIEVTGNNIDDIPNNIADDIRFVFTLNKTYDIVIGYDSINFLYNNIDSKYNVLYLKNSMINYLFKGSIKLHINNASDLNIYFSKIDRIICENNDVKKSLINNYKFNNSDILKIYGDYDELDLSEIDRIDDIHISNNEKQNVIIYPNKIKDCPEYQEKLLLDIQSDDYFQFEILLELGKLKSSLGDFISAKNYLQDALKYTDNEVLIDDINRELDKLNKYLDDIDILKTLVEKLI